MAKWVVNLQRREFTSARSEFGTSDWNAADGLRSGELEHVLPDYSIAAAPLHAVYPETQWMSLRARSFLDLLVERAGHFVPAPMHTQAAGADG